MADDDHSGRGGDGGRVRKTYLAVSTVLNASL